MECLLLDMKMNDRKGKTICSFGKKLMSACSEGPGAWSSGQTPIPIKDCNLDVSAHLSKLGLWSETLINCWKVTESWLISNRLANVCTIDEDLPICPKHRWENGIGWKLLKSCIYPDHKKTKRKCSSDWRKISPHVSNEICQLFSSAVKEIHVPIGSTWCNNCRLRVHPKYVMENELIIYPCVVCKESHNREEHTHTVTPQKKQCLDTESDADYSPHLSTKKDSLNESMKNLDSEWTPVKYQLHKD